jgi:hypothetical protein
MKKNLSSRSRVLSLSMMLVLCSSLLISVQPASSSAALQQGQAYIPQEGAMLGASVASGDIDGDGLDDIVAGAPLYDENPRLLDVGTVQVIFGDEGLLSVPVREVVIPSPVLEANATFGREVAVGDINGDGFQDIAIAAPKSDTGNQRDSGRVFVYLGSANFSGGTPITLDNPEPSLNGLFGSALATGDLNGDGVDDIAIGAPLANAGQGRVYYYQGGASLGARPTLTLNFPNPQPGGMARFGIALAAGNVNGDKFEDLLVGAPFAPAAGKTSAGQVFVFLGGSPFDATADATLQDPAPELGELFGLGLAVGDVNGDRIGDMAISAPDADVIDRDLVADAGRILVFFGGSTLDTKADAVLGFGSGFGGESAMAGGHLGAPLAAGDIDGDKIDDIIAGATGQGRNDSGRTFVYLGGPVLAVPVQGQTIGPDIVLQPNPEQDHGQFGRALAVGDVNGDLVGDVIIGSPSSDSGSRTEPLPDSGSVFVAFGGTPVLTKRSPGSTKMVTGYR